MDNIDDILEYMSVTFGDMAKALNIPIEELNCYLKTGEIEPKTVKRMYEILDVIVPNKDTGSNTDKLNTDKLMESALVTLIKDQTFDFKHTLYNFLICPTRNYTESNGGDNE